MDPPLTTIVIPAFDAAATIARTLASVAAQSRRDWEAVIVDDGSSDATAAIVARRIASDRRFRLIVQPNAGASAARNRGLAEARGAWTLFLDADDTIGRHHLRRMHARLRAAPAADAVCCGYRRQDAAGGVIARYPPPPLDRDAVGVCARRPPAAIHAFVSRTAALRALGGFDPGLATNEDWDLWLRLARSGRRFAVERRCLAHYWCAPGSLTRQGPAMLRDTLAMLTRIHPAGAPAGAVLEALLWNAGVAIGGGGDGLALVAQAPGLEAAAEMDAAVGALVEGLMLGLSVPPAGLLPAWTALAGRVETLLDAVGEACGSAAFGTVLARATEREVVRAGRFRGSVRIGRTIGVMLGPARLAAGLGPVAGIERMIGKLPFVRPRSLLMIEADMANGIGGRAIRRLLAGRARAHGGRLLARIGR